MLYILDGSLKKVSNNDIGFKEFLRLEFRR